MVTRYRIICAGLWLALQATIAYGLTASATVDRQSLQQNETLQLTVRIDDTGRYELQGLEKLDQDFYRLGTRQSSRVAYENGRSTAVTEWVVNLQPRRSGMLIIPSLAVDGATTQAMTVQVEQPDQQATTTDTVFLQASLDKDQVYLQEQAILTVRLFRRISLDDVSLSGIDIDGAEIKELTQSAYRRQIGSFIYQVNELRYGIYPQQTGELIIPELVFTAVEPDGGRRSVFSLPGQGKPLRRMSEQLPLTVVAPPSQATAGWLPASRLTLRQTWSTDSNELTVGDSLTRTITVEAEGVLPQQLPPVQTPEPDNARVYPDDSEQRSSESAEGVTAIRSDRTAFIATAPGSLTIPGYELRWWNTRTNQLETAAVPPRTFSVRAAAASATSAPQPMAEINAQSPQTATDPGWWPWLSAVLMVLWLTTIALYWRLQRRLPEQVLGSDVPHPAAPQAESKAFRRLRQACNNNSPQLAQRALLDWAGANWPEQTPVNMAEVRHCVDDPGWRSAIDALEASQYGRDGLEWHGEALLAAAENQRRNPGRAGKTEALKPLYAR